MLGKGKKPFSIKFQKNTEIKIALLKNINSVLKA